MARGGGGVGGRWVGDRTSKGASGGAGERGCLGKSLVFFLVLFLHAHHQGFKLRCATTQPPIPPTTTDTNKK